MVASVIVDIINTNVDKIFNYNIPIDCRVNIGDRVKVSFASRVIDGFVIDIKKHSDFKGELKNIEKVLSKTPDLSPEMIKLVWFMREKYHCTLSSVIRLCLPVQIRNNTKEKLISFIEVQSADLKLTDKQKQIVDFLMESGRILKSELQNKFSASIIQTLVDKEVLKITTIKSNRVPYKGLNNKLPEPELTSGQKGIVKQILDGREPVYLLHGVTGSGKTEIYINLIKKCLDNNRTAIMLVPEISLTPQMLTLFRSRFGEKVALLHSGLSSGEKNDEWNRIKDGEAKVVIGARSAIFAPVQNVGIIIIDEEHEESYQSDITPKYSTKEVAKFRCEFNNCSLVLASATPSVESYYKSEIGDYKLIELSERINKKSMPQIEIVDMRTEISMGNRSIFSKHLISNLEKCLENGHQAILFINRRGYSPKLICSKCGYVAKCNSCDVSLTYHQEENVLKCHYCGAKFRMPDVCPKCGYRHIRYVGAGTEKVEDELKKVFPRLRILRMDNDTTSGKDSHLDIVTKFSAQEADVLVGTQMIAKGHDFSNVSLVGIVDADLSLFFSDYRSAERTFQLVTQVAGRAGRGNSNGKVVLQTFNPDNYIFRLVKNYDYKNFYEREIALREICVYPPFGTIIRLIVTSENYDKALKVLKNNYYDISMLRDENKDKFVFFDKMKCPIQKIQKKARYQLVIRLVGADKYLIDKIYEINENNKENGVSSIVEINPMNMS